MIPDAVLPTPRPELVLQLGHNESLRSVVFTPDGLHLISAAWDNTVKIWRREPGGEDAIDRQNWALLRTVYAAGVVNAVALSPDGSTIACASSAVKDGREHGRIILWDARTGETLRHLDAHGDQVRSICFSPDGSMLVSGSTDGSAILWDVRTWSPRCTVQSEGQLIDSLSFSCNGSLVAAPQGQGAVLVRDTDTGDLQQQLKVETGFPHCIDAVAFSPRGPLLAVGTGGSIVFLWDTRTWKLYQTLKGCRSRVMAVAFAPDGQTVAATDIESVLAVWDVHRGKQRWRRCLHPREERRYSDSAAGGYALAFTPDGNLMAVGTGLYEHSIRFFDAQTGAREGALPDHDDWMTAIHFSPDGRTLAGGGLRDGTIRFWDMATGELTRTVKRGRDEVWLIGYSPDGAEILTSGGTGRRGVQRWDAHTDAWIGMLTDSRRGTCTLAFSPDGALVAAGGWFGEGEEYHGRLQLRDARTGRYVRSLRGHRDQVIALAFSPDGRMLASGAGEWCQPGEARLWEVASGRCLHTLTGHPNQVDSVTFSRDGRILVTAGIGPVGENDPIYCSDVRLWDVATGTLVGTLPESEDAASPLALSPDGVFLATTSEGTDVKLWDLETRALLRTLTGHTERIVDLAFSPAGDRLATASSDGTVRLWNPRTGATLATFVILPPDHPKSIATEWITFTPEGHYIGSEGAARFIRWRVGAELLPAERFEAEYRSPAAVSKALST